MDTSTSASRLPLLTGKVNPVLVLAVIIAAVTRLGWPGLVEFQYDESWALGVASTIARGQTLPLVGIGSSLEIPNAPFFVYLMALPELIGRDPRIANGFIGLLGVAAVAATYGLASCLFDRTTATAAVLFYAVSPWGIIYSRKIWGQDALPLFVTLGFWALFASLRNERRWLIAPGVIALTLATQLHPTAYFLVGPAFVLVLGCLAL
ncbi:MAG TPA: glycosyltransferase family 39 protein, partial [Chloroflexota bacterium]|nr:glycosyltransferase family 39 protein [Chloroflexota bacterium]